MNAETTDETVAEWLSMAENLRAITAGIKTEIEINGGDVREPGYEASIRRLEQVADSIEQRGREYAAALAPQTDPSAGSP
jgi:predicted AlkP superfamily phosphohydrolase/phosphomutase